MSSHVVRTRGRHRPSATARASRGRRAAAGAITIWAVAGCGVVVTEQSRMTGLAEEFADAWSEDRLEDAAALTDSPADALAALRATDEQMGARPDIDDLAADKNTGTVTAHLTWAVGSGSTWDYDVTWTVVTGDGDRLIRWRPSAIHPALLPGQTLGVRSVPAPRGELLDRAGSPLMNARPVVTVMLTPSATPDPAAVARTLATALQPIEPAIDASALTSAATGSQAGQVLEVVTLRREDYEVVRPAVYDLPGVTFLESSRVLGPTRSFAQPLLGRVGHPTAELLETLGEGYAATDEVGLSGIQGALEDELSGTPGQAVVALRDDGSAAAQLHTWDAVAGDSVALTLDSGIQVAAEEALATVAQAGALVAIQPSTGEILAVANSGADGGNRAFTGLYPPGSTFKVITAAAVLEAGLAAPDTVVECPDSITVNGQRIRNDPGVGDRGSIPFELAFAHSCNTSFIGYADDLPPAAFPDTAEQYGIGVDFVLPGATTNSGSLPPPTNANEAAEDSIGQGLVQASPFAMALAAATVARGSLPTPVLVHGRPATTDRTVTAPTDDVLTDVRQMMRAVVTDGSARGLADLGEVFGKTGTAQYGNGTRAHGWFIGYRADLAFAVLIESGDSSHDSAVPVAEAFLERLP